MRPPRIGLPSSRCVATQHTRPVQTRLLNLSSVRCRDRAPVRTRMFTRCLRCVQLRSLRTVPAARRRYPVPRAHRRRRHGDRNRMNALLRPDRVRRSRACVRRPRRRSLGRTRHGPARPRSRRSSPEAYGRYRCPRIPRWSRPCPQGRRGHRHCLLGLHDRPRRKRARHRCPRRSSKKNRPPPCSQLLRCTGLWTRQGRHPGSSRWHSHVHAHAACPR